MTTSGSHERFSELIGPFLREELSQDDARALEEHLFTCSDCRAEVTALRALTAACGSLTERERRDLHDGIETTLGEASAAAVVPLSPRWATAAKVLSAAAAVALIAAAGIWVGTSGTDDSGDNMGSAGGGGAGGNAAPESVREGRPRPSFLEATALALTQDVPD
ncbi:MAG: zf-HC2 domain-containing protein, partial [Actinomycetota bacterium]